jgi:methylthioribose-1-phosphate isomerase
VKLYELKAQKLMKQSLIAIRRDQKEKITSKIAPLYQIRTEIGTVTKVLCDAQKETHRNTISDKETRPKLQGKKKEEFFYDLHIKEKNDIKQVS